MDISFRRATAADLPAIVAIYNQVIDLHTVTADLAPVTVADRRDWFAAFDDHHPLWVATNSAGQVVGWVGLEPFYGRAAYQATAEIAIYFDRACHHQGLGTRALEWVEGRLTACQLTAVVAYIFGDNRPSLGLFKKFGYREWGRLLRVATLAGRDQDLVIMGKRYDQ